MINRYAFHIKRKTPSFLLRDEESYYCYFLGCSEWEIIIVLFHGGRQGRSIIILVVSEEGVSLFQLKVRSWLVGGTRAGSISVSDINENVVTCPGCDVTRRAASPKRK